MDFDFDQTHVIFLHFPIVLIWTVLIYDLIGAIWKVHVYPAGHWLLIAAALFAIPTFITGLSLENFSDNPYYAFHRIWGIVTFPYTLLHGLYRLYVILAKKRVHRIIFVLLSLLNVILVTITADYGGLMAFDYGFLKKKLPPPPSPIELPAQH